MPEGLSFLSLLWLTVPVGIVIAAVVADWVRLADDPSEIATERLRKQEVQRHAEIANRREFVSYLLTVIPEGRIRVLATLCKEATEFSDNDADVAACSMEGLIEKVHYVGYPGWFIYRLFPTYEDVVRSSPRVRERLGD